jgi:hypothetical protein
MNWTSLAVTGAGLWDQLDRYDDLNRYTQSEMQRLSDQAIAGSRFTPFSVGGYGGGATVGPAGGINVALDPTQQAQADQLTSSANALFSSATADPTAREGSIYDRIRAMQMPGEERAMNNLESRAFAQGRLGISGDAYGGSTPEMLGMMTAIGENRNTAAVRAIELARAQQQQDANIGLNFQNAAYLPQANMLNLLNPGMQAANMAQAGQLGGLNLATQLGLGGVQTQVNAERIRGDLLGQLYGAAAGGIAGSGSDPLGDIISAIFSGIGI